MKKEHKYKGIWKDFVRMLYQARLPYEWMVTALMLNLAKSGVELVMPRQVAKVLTDELSVQVLLISFGLGMILVVLTLAADVVKNISLQKIDRNMQRMSLKKILFLKTAEVEKKDPREMVSRVTTDTTQVSALCLDVALKEVPRVFFLLSSLFILFTRYDWRLALALMATIPITILGSFISGRLIFGRTEAVQAKIADLTAKLAEKIANFEIIKSYNNEDKETKSGDEVILELARTKKKQALIVRINTMITEIVKMLPIVFIVVVGAMLLLGEKIDVPTFVVFYQYSGTFINYVTEHLTLWVAIKNAQGATYRLGKILEMEDEYETADAQVAEGDIEFKDVSFCYGDKKVLDGVSFTIKKGQKTALVGHSGCGKSTTLNLIEQFYRPDAGQITIGGVDITEYDPQSYRGIFTYVPQNAPGFSGTVRELLTYGYRREIRDEELWSVLDKTGVKDTVELLGGLDYEVGTNAEKLSGGQKQKLSITRAMLSDTEYMLLDEATSALDVRATLALQKVIDEKTRNRTQIMVAHNLGTVINADKIIFFSEGRIAGEGSHEKLLASSEQYRELVENFNGNSQNKHAGHTTGSVNDGRCG